MDFMEGGSLTDTLGTSVNFKEMYIAYVCREILRALAFMHHQFRLHRDIKSDNVLVRVRFRFFLGFWQSVVFRSVVPLHGEMKADKRALVASRLLLARFDGDHKIFSTGVWRLRVKPSVGVSQGRADFFCSFSAVDKLSSDPAQKESRRF